MTEQEWVSLIAPDAVTACKRLGGYLPSVLIAQTCLETGYGTGSGCESLIQHHNILGMKSDLLNNTWDSLYWPGKSWTKKTPEWDGEKTIYIRDSFRIYPDNLACLCDYLQFMRDAKYGNGTYKYRDVMSYTDQYDLINTVSGRGYCTDPGYTPSVMRIISKHDLSRYDKMSYNTISGALKALGVDLIDRRAVNRSQVPAHNANEHKYFAVHYLGVNGENPDLYNHGYGGHFYVSKTGQVYQAAEVTDKLWHVGASSGFSYIHPDARNANTVGVECATYTASGRNNDSETWYFTEQTQIAAAKLAAAVMHVLGIPMSNLLRHGDITTKNCPSPLKRDEGKGPNWTWAKFKTEVQKYMAALGGDATTTTEPEVSLRKGDSGAEVKSLQNLLYKAGFCGCTTYSGNNKKAFVDGQFGANTDTAVRRLQEAVGLKVDGIYGPKTQKALKALTKGSKAVVTVAEFLTICKETAAENRALGFRYGDAPCMPAVYPECKLTSCDRFVDQCLYAAGYHDVGNRSVHDLSAWLLAKGGQKIAPDKVQAGDIAFMSGHTFIIGNPVGGGLWERYDSGSVHRIQLTGAYSGYKSQPFREGIAGVLYAVRMPFKAPAEEKPETIYRVQVGAYSVKSNADRMLKRAIDAGFTAFVSDYGAKVKDRYRVQIGAYQVYANAKKQRQRALDAGFNCIIRKEQLT